MEVTALCVTLMMTVLLLLVAHVDLSDSQHDAFLQVDPNRQQHFAYDSFTVSCEGLEGLTGWRVIRKIKGVVNTCSPSWSTSTGPCVIRNAYPALDSGEYWCEIGGGKKSNSVNITVADGSVILDSPARPVMLDDAVTLHCREKRTSSNLTADFYKDGHFMDSSSAGNLTIQGVSTSNEGLYRCSIPGVGQSPESWLTVREHTISSPAADEEPHHGVQLPLLLCIGVSVFLLALLLLVRLLRCRKRQTVTADITIPLSSVQYTSSPKTDTSCTQSPPQHSARPVCEEDGEAVWKHATYAAVTKPRRERDVEEPTFMPVYHTLSLGTD
ncbi:high affinity immunoglobulin gamma Fc receptor I-like [Epinephelus fuscoguttatus]|uniref:high affinity immunoglobulin gamma Fc receptor I-like n=1 Tax=Epinephelus fuscoguttatus TaxID=293821 RepID=UPI0020D1DE87|nr:high affinity immunoglobulin gamma Fc receptor I-like [Epinephelus fuscoguttatus]